MTYAKLINARDELSEYSFIHLVLTVRNCGAESLSAAVDTLCNSSSKLFRYKRVKTAYKGIFRAIEVSYNAEAKTFHPHLHCLVAVRKSYFTGRDYIPYADMVEMWKKALCVDYLP